MRRTRRAWMLLATVAVFAPGPAVAQDHALRGVALVIGESDYAALPDLANPANDARSVDDLLDRLGFEVTRVVDGDKAKIEDRLGRFLADAAGADVALIYYSGHGIEAGGENFLVPVDADVSSPSAAGQGLIVVQDVLEKLAQTVPVTIALIDACRTDPFPAGLQIEMPGSHQLVEAREAGLALMRGPTPVARTEMPVDTLGVVIGFAAAPGQAALDGPADGDSPYAAALLKHLGAGGYSFADLMTMVTQEVYLKTGGRQLPWTNSSLMQVLSFGHPAAATDPDEAAIADGRRRLLLSVAATPPEERHQVEVAAAAGDVPMDALYGLLESLGAKAPSDRAELARLLQTQAQQVKKLRAEAAGGDVSDPHIAEFTRYADEAQAEGVLSLAGVYRAKASARAKELEDARKARDAADFLEYAATYAREAETAATNAQFKLAASKFEQAYETALYWDKVQALTYRWEQAAALQQQGSTYGDLAALDASMAVFGEVVAIVPATEKPLYWAAAVAGLARTQTIVGARRGDMDMLVRAVDAFDRALEKVSAKTSLSQWTEIESQRADALTQLGNVKGDFRILFKARDAYALQLETNRPVANDAQLAAMKSDLATSEASLGMVMRNPYFLQQAIAHFSELQPYLAESGSRDDMAHNKSEIGNALRILGEYTGDSKSLHLAIAAFREASSLWDRTRFPLSWADSEDKLAYALFALGNLAHDRSAHEEAATHYEVALQSRTRDSDPMSWARGSFNFANVLVALGTRESLEQARTVYLDALSVWTRDEHPDDWAAAESGLKTTEAALARVSGGN